MPSDIEAADVVIAGGALVGSAAAYFLSEHPDFDGSIIVVERDPSYLTASSALSLSSIREQFRHPVNIRASQFGMEFFDTFHQRVQVDGEAPDLGYRRTGYLFLATAEMIDDFRALNALQRQHGVEARLIEPEEIVSRFPYFSVDELAGASLGSPREGSVDAWALLQGFRRRARHNGVEYLADTVAGLGQRSGRVETVELDSGRRVRCGAFINAAGTRADQIASMAGLHVPVEPRCRSVFMFDCRQPIDQDVPLTITPEGVYFRREGDQFVAGVSPSFDPAVDHDDFAVRHAEFTDTVWPALARYVPQFDAIGVTSSWAGHYAYNTFDQNMIVGPSPTVPNFYFANGFSGHGFQHSPAVGRALSELIVDGRYTTLDMSSLGVERLAEGNPSTETAII